MNVSFDLQGGAIIVHLYLSSVAIGEEFEPGAYVRMAIQTGKGQPETDKRQTTHLVMNKSEARAVASAIMGIAAEIA